MSNCLITMSTHILLASKTDAASAVVFVLFRVDGGINGGDDNSLGESKLKVSIFKFHFSPKDFVYASF